MQVNILGSTFVIVETPNISHGGTEKGSINYLEQIITIKSDLHPEKKKITLIHEILHSIFEQLGFTAECECEKLICTLSTTLYQLFNTNKDITSYLFPCSKS